MTCMNDDDIWPVGYCASRLCYHTTPEEASDCYRSYLEKECSGKFPGGFTTERAENERGTVLIFASSY